MPGRSAASGQGRVRRQFVAAARRPGALAVDKGRPEAEPFAEMAHPHSGLAAGPVHQSHAAPQGTGHIPYVQGSGSGQAFAGAFRGRGHFGGC